MVSRAQLKRDLANIEASDRYYDAIVALRDAIGGYDFGSPEVLAAKARLAKAATALRRRKIGNGV